MVGNSRERKKRTLEKESGENLRKLEEEAFLVKQERLRKVAS